MFKVWKETGMTKAEKVNALKILRAFVKSKEFKNRSGLCSSIMIVNITREQRDYLWSIIPTKTPYGDFCWKPREKVPRIAFLDKKIERLEKK